MLQNYCPTSQKSTVLIRQAFFPIKTNSRRDYFTVDFLYSDGVVPVIRRNAVLKEDFEL